MRKFAVFAVLIFLLFLLSFGWAKSYFHPSIEQTFLLRDNGDVEVTEKRSFSFEGSFSWARLAIRCKGVADVVFEGIWELLPFEAEREA